MSWHFYFKGGWIRAFGWCVCWKDVTVHGLIFSERSGHVKRIQIGNWSFKLIK